MANERKIGVVIIDDHAMTRIGLKFMLKTFDDITLLGEAESGEEAYEVCANAHPDVALIDMLLPDIDGPSVIAALRQRQPNLRMVALSSFGDCALVERAIQAGAISYVLKNVSAFDLAQAIRRAYQGKTTLSPEAAQVLVEQMQHPDQAQVEFTEREAAVLQHIAQGLSNSQIATKMHISSATVKGHVGSILSKLGVATRSEAIAHAWSHGLVKTDG